jgi:hypothetical protein
MLIPAFMARHEGPHDCCGKHEPPIAFDENDEPERRESTRSPSKTRLIRRVHFQHSFSCKKLQCCVVSRILFSHRRRSRIILCLCKCRRCVQRCEKRGCRKRCKFGCERHKHTASFLAPPEEGQEPVHLCDQAMCLDVCPYPKCRRVCTLPHWHLVIGRSLSCPSPCMTMPPLLTSSHSSHSILLTMPHLLASSHSISLTMPPLLASSHSISPCRSRIPLWLHSRSQKVHPGCGDGQGCPGGEGCKGGHCSTCS